ncbi:hypothetical protein A5842_001517, partial [Enterococcus faecium]
VWKIKTIVNAVAVSYTHLDVYKRQVNMQIKSIVWKIKTIVNAVALNFKYKLKCCLLYTSRCV